MGGFVLQAPDLMVAEAVAPRRLVQLHVDGSPHVIRLRRATLWHCDAGSGRRPPHHLQTSRPPTLAANELAPRGFGFSLTGQICKSHRFFPSRPSIVASPNERKAAP